MCVQCDVIPHSYLHNLQSHDICIMYGIGSKPNQTKPNHVFGMWTQAIWLFPSTMGFKEFKSPRPRVNPKKALYLLKTRYIYI
jgi:hypothetical protein